MRVFTVVIAALLLSVVFGCDGTVEHPRPVASLTDSNTDVVIQRAAKQRQIEMKNRLSQPRSAVRSASPHAMSGNGSSLIRSVSRDYDVPAGLLYGIWQKESGGLSQGWSAGSWWPRAASLTDRGGSCRKEYDRNFCTRQWRAILAICSQKIANREMCDPHAVCVSPAGAMGPMQHLPTTLTNESGGQVTWATHAVDYDHNGVFDPHALPDAMAATALLLRRLYAKHGSWQRAANAYLGSQSRGYFEGTTSGRRGVIDYWREWCASQGNCL